MEAEKSCSICAQRLCRLCILSALSWQTTSCPRSCTASAGGCPGIYSVLKSAGLAYHGLPQGGQCENPQRRRQCASVQGHVSESSVSHLHRTSSEDIAEMAMKPRGQLNQPLGVSLSGPDTRMASLASSAYLDLRFTKPSHAGSLQGHCHPSQCSRLREVLSSFGDDLIPIKPRRNTISY